MRYTPACLIALGVLLFVYGYLRTNAVIAFSSRDHRVQVAATQVAERMTVAEAQRVFDMPPNIQDREAWMRANLGWNGAGPGSYAAWEVMPVIGLGAVLLAWGVAEKRARTSSR